MLVTINSQVKNWWLWYEYIRWHFLFLLYITKNKNKEIPKNYTINSKTMQTVLNTNIIVEVI